VNSHRPANREQEMKSTPASQRKKKKAEEEKEVAGLAIVDG